MNMSDFFPAPSTEYDEYLGYEAGVPTEDLSPYMEEIELVSLSDEQEPGIETLVTDIELKQLPVYESMRCLKPRRKDWR